MTKFYRATQRGAVEARESADGKDLPKGFTENKVLCDRAAKALRDRPHFWRDYQDWVLAGMQRPMPERFGGDPGEPDDGKPDPDDGPEVVTGVVDDRPRRGRPSKQEI